MVRDTITDLSIMMDEYEETKDKQNENKEDTKGIVVELYTADQGHYNDPIGNDQPQKKKNLTYSKDSAALSISSEARGKLPEKTINTIESVESNQEEIDTWVKKYQENQINKLKEQGST